MQHARNCSVRCDQPNGRAGVGWPGSMMRRSGRGSVTNGCCANRCGGGASCHGDGTPYTAGLSRKHPGVG
jgi:hypothetical protein